MTSTISFIIGLLLRYLTLARSTSGVGTSPKPFCNCHCATCIVSNQQMEKHSDPPPTARTRPTSAVEAVATGAQSAAPGAQSAAPGAQAGAPSTATACSAIGPLKPPVRNTDDAPRNVRVQVEAFGSGAILHGGLDVPTNKPVGDLRKLVLSSIKLPPRTRTVRLFVGHGGTELDKDDEALLSGSLAAVDLDTTPLVAFPVPCTSVVALVLQQHSRR